MAKTVTFDVLAVAHGVGFDELGNKIKGVARDSQVHVSSLVAAITAVGPAMIPIAAATSAVGAGLAGLGAAGLVAFLALKEQWKQGTLQATALGQQITRLNVNFAGLKATTATAIAPGLTIGLKAVNSLTVPLGFAFEKLATQLGKIAGNVVPALVLVFLKLMPLFTSIGDQLVRGSAAFLRWAQSGTGVTKFVDYAQANLPKVEKIVGQLVTAIARLSQGLLPLGGISLSTIGVFARLVNTIPVPVLKQIAPIIYGIVLATKAWEVAAKALNIVLGLNPFVRIAILILAIGTALVVVYKQSEAFRNVVNRVFIDVGETAVHAMQSIYHGFVSPFLTAIAAILGALGHLPFGMGAPFRKAAEEVRGLRDNIGNMIDAAQRKMDTLKAKVDIAQAVGNLAKLQVIVNGLRDKTVTVTTYLDFVNRTFNLGVQSVTHDSHRAAGGPVMAGQSYIVGELRPEVFTPSQSGYITPYVPATAGTTVNVYVTNQDPRATVRAIEQWVGGGGKIHGGRGIVP